MWRNIASVLQTKTRRRWSCQGTHLNFLLSFVNLINYSHYSESPSPKKARSKVSSILPTTRFVIAVDSILIPLNLFLFNYLGVKNELLLLRTPKMKKFISQGMFANNKIYSLYFNLYLVGSMRPLRKLTQRKPQILLSP